MKAYDRALAATVAINLLCVFHIHTHPFASALPVIVFVHWLNSSPLRSITNTVEVLVVLWTWVGVCLISDLLFWVEPRPGHVSLPTPVQIFFVLASCVGVLLQRFAGRMQNHTRPSTVLMVDETIICTTGPYRLVRHPGSSASVLLLISYALLVSRNWIFGSVCASVVLLAYLQMAATQEVALKKRFPFEYKQFCERTQAMLIPFLL